MTIIPYANLVTSFVSSHCACKSLFLSILTIHTLLHKCLFHFLHHNSILNWYSISKSPNVVCTNEKDMVQISLWVMHPKLQLHINYMLVYSWWLLNCRTFILIRYWYYLDFYSKLLHKSVYGSTETIDINGKKTRNVMNIFFSSKTGNELPFDIFVL